MTNVAKENSRKDGLGFLLEAFTHEQKLLEAKINAAHATITHNGVMGDVIESSWVHDFLKRYLPDRYAISSGIVIDSAGQTSDQIDILIYDNQYTPALLTQSNHRFIPAESVYAILEVKPLINKEYLDYASLKAASVRKLHRTSVPIRHAGGVYGAKVPHHIVAGIVAQKAEWVDGLGKSFKSNIKVINSNDDTLLDCGCALQNGAFDFFDPVFNTDENIDLRQIDKSINIKEADNSLVYFMFRLLGRLQAIGTVPAVDWGRYAEVFKTAHI